MRVLLAHSAYTSALPSGENRSVELQAERLREAGVEVHEFLKSNDELLLGRRERLMGAFEALGHGKTVRAFRDALETFRPDVVHIENLYPRLSPAVAQIARSYNIPVVASVRNYRLACAAGSLRRGGETCRDCVTGSLGNMPAVLHGCYRRSRPASAVIAASMSLYAEEMQDLSHYLPVSEHMAAFLRKDCGIDPERITVRPNSGTHDRAIPSSPPERNVLFAGRLDDSKGVRLLLNAWRAVNAPGWSLRIAGSGELEDLVSDASRHDTSIKYLGLLDATQLSVEYHQAAWVIVPSIWEEPFGRTVVEAYSYSRPVLVTSVGGLPELIQPATGRIVSPTSAAIAQAFQELLAETPDTYTRRTIATERYYNSRFTPQANIATALEVYCTLVGYRSGQHRR